MLRTVNADRRASTVLYGRPCDRRPLGLVNVGFLRGNQASHDPLVVPALQSRRDVGDTAPSPTSFRTGRRAVLATGGARSDRGWGEVSVVSNHDGECRDSVPSRPLALRTSGGCPRLRACFHSSWLSSQPRIRWSGMFEWSVVVLVETEHLQKPRKRMRPTKRPRQRRAVTGSSRRSRTSMNTCGSGHHRPVVAAHPRTNPRKRARSLGFFGGRHLRLGKIGRIDVR